MLTYVLGVFFHLLDHEITCFVIYYAHTDIVQAEICCAFDLNLLYSDGLSAIVLNCNTFSSKQSTVPY